MSNINGPIDKPEKCGIEVKVTNRCNQFCLYCVNADGAVGGRDIDHALLIERLRQWAESANPAQKIEEVRLTGGEPLLNEIGVAAIVSTCSTIGIVSGINTNGSLMTPDKAYRLKEAGMSVVKVSLDTLRADTFRKICGSEAVLENTLDGIRTAVDAGFETIIRFTLSRINEDELGRCYEFAASVGASRFQVKPLISAGRGKMCGEWLDHSELLNVIENFSHHIHSATARIEFLCIPPENTFGLPARACGSINKIYISENGRISSCNYLSDGFLGNISDRSLDRILHTRSLSTRMELFNGHQVLAGCPQYRSN